MKAYVAYLGVTSENQATLGLNDQKRDIDDFLENVAAQPWRLIGCFTDDLGKTSEDRPQLQAALNLVRSTPRAELLIASLSVLDHHEACTASLLQDPRVRVRAASMSNADPAQLRIFKNIAEQSRRVGGRSVSPTPPAFHSGVTAIVSSWDLEAVQSATSHTGKGAPASHLKIIITALRNQGMSHRAIAKRLNEAGIKTARERLWVGSKVQRILRKVQAGQLLEQISCHPDAPILAEEDMTA